jgi:hypothetical protein
MGATALPPRMNKVVATRQATLRQLGFGNSALAVGCGQTLGLHPGSKWSGHRVDEASRISGRTVRTSRYQPVVKASTVSCTNVLGQLSDRCTEAVSTTGPVQSCGATGRPRASASVAIFFASPRPALQEPR